MSTDILSEMLDCNSPKEVWAVLQARFSSWNMARVLDLKGKLESTKREI